MTRYPRFSNWSAMVLTGTLVLLSNAKAFQADVNSGDWPEVNHDKLGTRYSPLLLQSNDQRFPAGQVKMLVITRLCDADLTHPASMKGLIVLFARTVNASFSSLRGPILYMRNT